mmetsp:Transcript_36010/g.59224  ORF Transcript_36010/g.59224 Transcript_36010/m.59224 type:complete len:340 (+) Transcript_36010:258-1277(+)
MKKDFKALFTDSSMQHEFLDSESNLGREAFEVTRNIMAAQPTCPINKYILLQIASGNLLSKKVNQDFPSSSDQNNGKSYCFEGTETTSWLDQEEEEEGNLESFDDDQCLFSFYGAVSLHKSQRNTWRAVLQNPETPSHCIGMHLEGFLRRAKYFFDKISKPTGRSKSKRKRLTKLDAVATEMAKQVLKGRLKNPIDQAFDATLSGSFVMVKLPNNAWWPAKLVFVKHPFLEYALWKKDISLVQLVGQAGVYKVSHSTSGKEIVTLRATRNQDQKIIHLLELLSNAEKNKQCRTREKVILRCLAKETKKYSKQRSSTTTAAASSLASKKRRRNHDTAEDI